MLALVVWGGGDGIRAVALREPPDVGGGIRKGSSSVHFDGFDGVPLIG